MLLLDPRVQRRIAVCVVAATGLILMSCGRRPTTTTVQAQATHPEQMSLVTLAPGFRIGREFRDAENTTYMVKEIQGTWVKVQVIDLGVIGGNVDEGDVFWMNTTQFERVQFMDESR